RRALAPRVRGNLAYLARRRLVAKSGTGKSACWAITTEALVARLQELHGVVCQPFRVEVAVLGQVKDRESKIKAGWRNSLGAATDAWAQPGPRIVQGLPHRFQLIWIVRRFLEELAGFHGYPLAAAPRRLLIARPGQSPQPEGDVTGIGTALSLV